MGSPLPPFIDRDDPIITQSKIPIAPYDPRTWGFKTRCQHGTNVPGVWPDADHQHGLLLYCDRTNRWNYQAVHSNGALDSKEMLKDQNTAKALLSCFGWLLPQACHLGFSPMTDITFPLATQAIVTDGQTWNFYAYQLNTTDLTPNSPEEHSHNNVMWVGEDQVLFDRVENGKVVNFSPSALAPLVKMLLLEPQTLPKQCKDRLEFPRPFPEEVDVGDYQEYLQQQAEAQRQARDVLMGEDAPGRSFWTMGTHARSQEEEMVSDV